MATVQSVVIANTAATRDCSMGIAHRKRTRDLVARITKREDDQERLLYQLHLELPERPEPIQTVKCSADSAIA